jgi:hypothetical protein
MIQANLVPRANFEPDQVDNLKDVQYSCGCAKLDNEVVTLCARHGLEKLRATNSREEFRQEASNETK